MVKTSFLGVAYIHMYVLSIKLIHFQVNILNLSNKRRRYWIWISCCLERIPINYFAMATKAFFGLCFCINSSSSIEKDSHKKIRTLKFQSLPIRVACEWGVQIMVNKNTFITCIGTKLHQSLPNAYSYYVELLFAHI